ncbi:MAG: hypothetical protein L3K08_02805 [Thermoplasmata archaeon]|nr:hypothetical protein [Thermoplasmata archaeon]
MLPSRFLRGFSAGEIRFLRMRSILYTLRFAILVSVLLVLLDFGVIHP